ncbi:conserved hypothetical protein [Xenorhabdus nematophila F1]|uniref:Uncharacterized protein n=1 Tax=Xenorhabdus nematophila (strain ATCC 19061 / DSM 3370 / CCUG 14189 / LMG 1036 / NCIMB 9965 / AN6) TaxID=406817 RepID=D3VL24_XENNA|nr:hypothetical protein XNC1_0912 [Xenorhabdus nematophila ATCC 19061]CCW32670.1 conserved hypothetical protein [Xenorhabdus nematophila F1]CEE93213.1 hypothetical protein XNA1_350037 [Xenorhabdus nematophila str. Anatoliense]CEF29367.1 hypothetical protein XNW1_1700034 [Xenorhabdus nematophila str. Websteri]CEK21890.1 hypothetical protein XNC2_0894 [Xenorhabdus nematophila AN6/1]
MLAKLYFLKFVKIAIFYAIEKFNWTLTNRVCSDGIECYFMRLESLWY